jgi:sensor histidine kinase YesM
MPPFRPIPDDSLKLLSIRGLGLSVPLVWCLIGFIDSLRAVTYMRSSQQPVAWAPIALHGIGEAIEWTLITWGLLVLLDHWPEKRRTSIALAVIVAVGGGMIIVLWGATLFSLSGISKERIIPLFLVLLPRDFHGTMFEVVVIMGMGLALRDRYAAETRRVREAKLETQLLQAQLHSISAQLQPHFLFNTLNAITVLLHKDVRLAEQMITGLGDLLRLSISHARDELGTLDDELYFVERYLFLQHMRLASRLEVRIDADAETRRMPFPRFILQPLVENAVKHGIDASDRPGEVSITADKSDERLMVRIRNSVPDGLPWKPDGVGLSSVRQRLELLFGVEHALDFSTADGAVTVSISVPASQSPSTSAPRRSR